MPLFSKPNPWDESSHIIVNDKLIMRYAELLAGKRSNLASASRNTLQELGRLVYNMRQETKIPDLDLISLISPILYPTLVNCIKKEKPSYKLRVGRALIHLSKLVKNDSYIYSEQREIGIRAVEFQSVMKDFWWLDVSSKSRQDLNDRQINNKTTLPSAADMMKLDEYLKRNITQIVVNLDENPNIEDYDFLQKALLRLIVVFNRKRVVDF